MRKLAMAFSLSAGILALTACSSSGDDSEVVVETEAGNVTKEQFYEELKTQNGESVLQELVLRTVLEGQYDVSEEEVDAQINELKDQYGDQFEMVLQQSGFSDEDEFREVLRLNILQEKALTEDIEVTDEEIQQAYEREKTEIEASHILVEDEETAQNLREEIEEGADFATIAEANSVDPGSAEAGGELGFFGTGAMVPEFEEAAYNLEVGEISEPIQTTNGWHIIKVTDKREVEDIAPLEEMEDELRRQIATEKIDQTAAQEKLQQLMDDANIDVKIEEYQGLFDNQVPAATEEPAAEESTEEQPATEEESSEEGSTEEETTE